MPECVFAGEGDCRGRLTVHHILSQQRIRREWNRAVSAERHTGVLAWPLNKSLNDERNFVFVCFHHHMQVEAKRLYVTIPQVAYEFARELGLEALLDADVARARVPVRAGCRVNISSSRGLRGA